MIDLCLVFFHRMMVRTDSELWRGREQSSEFVFFQSGEFLIRGFLSVDKLSTLPRVMA